MRLSIHFPLLVFTVCFFFFLLSASTRNKINAMSQLFLGSGSLGLRGFCYRKQSSLRRGRIFINDSTEVSWHPHRCSYSIYACDWSPFRKVCVCVWTEFLLTHSIFNVLGQFWVPKRTQLQNKLLSVWKCFYNKHNWSVVFWFLVCFIQIRDFWSVASLNLYITFMQWMGLYTSINFSINIWQLNCEISFQND